MKSLTPTGPRRVCALALATVSLAALLSGDAAAQDVWTTPAPGVSYLERTAPGPFKIHAAVVDISRDDLYVRATRPDERGRTTTNFAQHVGAVVAINGDWGSSAFQPVGLAVGDGLHWEGTADQGWAFIACNVENECHYGTHEVNEELNWRWHEVVGGNGWRLLIDGQIPTYPPESFYTDRHPRSAVGTSADGNTMFFVVVEGRRPESIGMGFAEIAGLMQELGAHQALMLDGGGSSALVINQSRVNNLPTNESGERTVTNHLAILRGTPDPRCAATPNGRTCEGSVIHTCRGGGHHGEGDCGFFGASCDITSDGVGVCTHPFCENGPESSFCESDTILRTCSYGRLGDPGDCAFFGATCEDGLGDSYCVHFACTEGGNARWCDGEIARECINGQPQDEVDCAAQGLRCDVGGCVDPQAPAPEPDAGHPPDAGHDLPDADLPDADLPDAGATSPGAPTGQTATTSSCAGCSSTTTTPPASLLLLLVALSATVLLRRRPPASSHL